MLNTIFTVIICIGAPYLITSICFAKFGVSGGFGSMVLCLMALFIYLKPGIFTILGKRKYFSDHEDGFKWLEKAYKTGRMKPQQGLIYAYLLLRDGYLDKSEKLISGILYQKKAQLTEQNLLAADLNKALILWKRNDLKGAIALMESVYDKNYRSTVHYGTLGYFYILNNQLDKAEQFCKEAVEYNSEDANIADNLGKLYICKNDLDQAEKVYEKIFSKEAPSFIEPYYNYATVLEKKGKFPEAIDYYQKALGCPEKYLSTVKLAQVEAALSRVEALTK